MHRRGVLDCTSLRESLKGKPLERLIGTSPDTRLDAEHFIYLLVDGVERLQPNERDVPFDKTEHVEDVPAVMYENERHYPMVGWSSKLLPGYGNAPSLTTAIVATIAPHHHQKHTHAHIRTHTLSLTHTLTHTHNRRDWHHWSALDGTVRVRKDVDFHDFDWGTPASVWAVTI